ncbi:MAG: peptidase M61 [Novosphingobium sp.]|nr:peptidase M61 [Novosphingobium sp.]
MLTIAATSALTLPANAQIDGPRPVDCSAAAVCFNLPYPADEPWPGGTIRLAIDATDVTRGAYRVTQTIPLAPGTDRVTLLYPQWLPGHHAPRGPIAELVDLRFFADGQAVTWKRDPVDVYAFHVDLPAGARELVARFIHTSPLRTAQGRVTMTPRMLNLQWEKMSLYPAGHAVNRIRVRPEVTFPAGWGVATALEGQVRDGDRVVWSETDYETLVDSPIFAGAFMQGWNLGNSVRMFAVADSPELLALRNEDAARLPALVEEALLLFGRPPFDHYTFLVALSDQLGGIGLEHLKSSENQLEPRNFIQWDQYDWDRNVLAHELVHSWNGKYRRPSGLVTRDYRQPMINDLLWVYEGQTQFWGWVLAVRSGLQSKETVLGMIANAAGALAEEPGRGWRSVADTTLDPIVAARKSKPYLSLARGEAYYNEGALLWLEADQLIRRGTGGRRGLDDFARAFFSHDGSAARIMPYDFNDVVATLNAIYPYDWRGFITSRIDEAGRAAPVAGIELAGYRLVWKPEPNPFTKARMEKEHVLDLGFSLGLEVDHDGTVNASIWGGPAFNAGIVSGLKIIAVDGIAFSSSVLSMAIARAQATKQPIQLLTRRGDLFETVAVPYFGGLRWPWLEPADSRRGAGLDQLLAPRSRR